MTLTVMTYNVKTGGAPDRLDRIVEVITANRPDVLALQELRGFDRARTRQVAGVLGMAAFLGRSWFGQPVAVLVREPAPVISARRIRRPFHHAAVEVVVATDRGPLAVIGAHLYPYSGRRRLWEARWLASLVDSGRLMLLMGDLNSLDPWTDYAARLRDLSPRYRSRHLRHGGLVDSRAVAVLVDAGLVDLFVRAGTGGKDYTAPTEDSGGTEFSKLRLDYILGTEPVARVTKACRIVSGGACEHASDHYPVVAELDLSLAR
jgi:exodeoxyribonuclease III